MLWGLTGEASEPDKWGGGWKGKEHPSFPTCRREWRPGRIAEQRKNWCQKKNGRPGRPHAPASIRRNPGGVEPVHAPIRLFLETSLFWRKFREMAFPQKSNSRTHLALNPSCSEDTTSAPTAEKAGCSSQGGLQGGSCCEWTAWKAPRHPADMFWPGPRARAAFNARLSNSLRLLLGRYRLPIGLIKGCKPGKKLKLLTFCSGMN